MSAWVDRCGLSLALVLGVSAMTSCKKAGDSATSPDATAMPLAERAAPADPLAELAALEQRMQVLGLSPARPRAPVSSEAEAEAKQVDEEKPTEAPTMVEEEDLGAGSARDYRSGDKQAPPPEPAGGDAFADEAQGVDYCESVCELSTAICELEVRICGMAQDHGDEPVYADACERAIDDCDVAGDACDACERD